VDKKEREILVLMSTDSALKIFDTLSRDGRYLSVVWCCQEYASDVLPGTF